MNFPRRLWAISARPHFSPIYAESSSSSRSTIEHIRPEDDRVMRAILQGTRRELGIEELEGQAWSNGELDSLSRFFGRPGYGYFVARLPDQGVVGGVGFAPSRGSKARCEMRGLYVDRKSRGGGLGRKLAMHCLREARALGYRDCIARTRDQMPKARSLYEKLGFQLIATPNLDAGQPHYIYRRDLSLPLANGLHPH